MLANGDYKLWTSGPVAQTVILADDTATRKYDIGFGDGYHSAAAALLRDLLARDASGFGAVRGRERQYRRAARICPTASP